MSDGVASLEIMVGTRLGRRATFRCGFCRTTNRDASNVRHVHYVHFHCLLSDTPAQIQNEACSLQSVAIPHFCVSR
jgi:hypothetical protein